jgi:hypothetical protein
MRAPLNRSRPRRITMTFAALVLFIVAASILMSGYAVAHRGKHATPHLTVTDRNPATVGGTGFKPRSRVRVTLTAGQTFVRRPIANRHGAFTATFPTAIDLCTSWSVSASQRHQAVVVLHGPKPECAPASTP